MPVVVKMSRLDNKILHLQEPAHSSAQMALYCSQHTREALRLQQLVHALVQHALAAKMPCLQKIGCALAKDSPRVILHCSLL
jgi:hypothetical protein